MESLRAGARRLATDLAAVETGMDELYDAASGRGLRERRPGVRPSPRRRAQEPKPAPEPPAAAEEPAPAPEPPKAAPAPAAAAPEPASAPEPPQEAKETVPATSTAPAWSR